MRWTILAMIAAIAVGCVQDDLDAPGELAPLDEAFFRCNVEPVLVKHCGTFACHGTVDRPFQVYGRSRHRMAELPWDFTDWAAPLSEAEQRANFDHARGYVAANAADSMLLLKPLEAEAGGYFHRGKDLFGDQDVFADASDPEFQLIEDWIAGATGAAACETEEPQS